MDNHERRIGPASPAAAPENRKPSRSRTPSIKARAAATQITQDSRDKLARGTYQKGRLWDPDDDSAAPRPRTYDKSNVATYQHHRPSSASAPKPHSKAHPLPPAQAPAPLPTDDGPTEIIKQPETRPISQEQLVAEVKGIYAGLVMVESKCVEVDNNQSSSSQSDPANNLNNEQWQALIALHRTLLHEHHDFFLASQHPSASPALRRLAAKYAMPSSMWRHGIHSFLELLRHRLPASLDHMLAFIYIAYSMIAELHETVPGFEVTWIECLGDLGRSRMAIEDDDIQDREVWTAVPRQWYSRARDKAPTTGRLDHHLAILARPNALQQLHRYSRSLCIGHTGISFPPTTTIRDRRVPGTINGLKIDALPDSGADTSFISASFLRKLQLDRQQAGDHGMAIKILSSDPNSPPLLLPPVQLASGKTVTPTTIVSIPWRFQGESRVHWLACHVLPRCAHDLILGDSFLRATETLTRFKKRIVTTLRSLGSKLLRLNYMGSGGFESVSGSVKRRRVWGTLDGEGVAALPDSGSDIMAVSGEYARRRGWRVDGGREKRVEVEFADGSTAWTEGVVSGLDWEFEGAGGKVRSDFYVLEDLPVDVVFSSDFVFGYDVFGRYDRSIRRHREFLDVLQLCNIRLIGDCRNLARAEEEGVVDMTSPDAFSPLMIGQELARRDAIGDMIAALPMAEQALAQQVEAERQRQWEQRRTEHAQRWSVLEPNTADLQGSGGETSRFLRARRWARRNLKVVSIPLMPLRKRVPEPGEV